MHCRRSHITSNYPDPMLEGGCSHFDALPGAEKESLMLRTRAARQAFSPPPSELSSHSFKHPRDRRATATAGGSELSHLVRR